VNLRPHLVVTSRYRTPKKFGVAGPLRRAVVIVALFLLLAPPLAPARGDSATSQVHAAWKEFHKAYAHQAGRRLCALLAPNAREQLEVQVARGRCLAAATAWFASPEYDPQAASHARLLSVQVQGRRAQTTDSDPNSPAGAWVDESGHWKLASFVLLG
jgi:hypothetical protein